MIEIDNPFDFALWCAALLALSLADGLLLGLLLAKVLGLYY